MKCRQYLQVTVPDAIRDDAGTFSNDPFSRTDDSAFATDGREQGQSLHASEDRL